MSPQTRNVLFTYEDYLLFPEDGRRHELMGGEHYVTPAPTTKHQQASGNLFGLIHAHLRHTKTGRLFSAPTDVVLSDLDVVQPDLLLVSASRVAIITEKHIHGAPDLVIEILSETTRKTDEIVKRKLYERYGVAEYWIVDPELETVKVYRLTDQVYMRATELAKEAGDILATPLLPGFQLSLTEIFD